jgi:hypothetical protein
MQFKKFFFQAALGVAMVMSSDGQVFSTNAVGYVNTVVPAHGMTLISNPLFAGENTIAELFTDAAAESARGLTVYKFIPGDSPRYKIFNFDAESGTWTGDDAMTETTEPGEGVFVRNPAPVSVTITFVGAILQGDLKNPIPAGLSIKSSMVPQDGTLTELGYVPSPGDQIYQFDVKTQKYYVSTFDPEFHEFDTPLKRLHTGEAVFIRSVNGGSWDRTFFVNALDP